MRKINNYELLCEIERVLKHTPMSRQQIMDYFGKGKTCITVSLQKLKELKKIHIYEYVMDSHRKIPIYCYGNFKDAVYFKPSDAIRQREYRAKVKQRELLKDSKNFIPRPDYAAAWLWNPIK